MLYSDVVFKNQNSKDTSAILNQVYLVERQIDSVDGKSRFHQLMASALPIQYFFKCNTCLNFCYFSKLLAICKRQKPKILT